MVTGLPIGSIEGAVPHAIQGSSEDVSSRGDVFGHRSHCEHHGPQSHRSSPSRFGRRHHCHHDHHHQKGPFGLAHRHGHGDHHGHCDHHGAHGGRKHHGGPHHGLRGRYVSRRFHDVSRHGPWSHCRRRMHRSLSPHHLMHDMSNDDSLGSQHMGHRGHRGRCGRVPCDGSFYVIAFSERHLHFHSQELTSGSESNRSSPVPAAIEQGIAQFGQLSLRSESGSH